MSNVFYFPKEAWNKLKLKEQEALKSAIEHIPVYNSDPNLYNYTSRYHGNLVLDVSLTYSETREDPKDREIRQLRLKLSELESIKNSIANIKKFTEGI